MVTQDGAADKRAGCRKESKHTLLVRDTASAGDLGLQRAHKGGCAEAVDIDVCTPGCGDGGFGDILLGCLLVSLIAKRHRSEVERRVEIVST